MKRIALAVLLIPLTLFEIWLCTAFLPIKWQLAINDHMTNILPRSHDWTPITHPMMSQEIDQVLNEHIGVRIALFTATLALLIGNAWLIRRVWRFLVRHGSSEGR